MRTKSLSSASRVPCCPRSAFVIAGVMAVAFATNPQCATAAPFIWDGGGADANSATIANWNPDASVTTNSDITFDIAGVSGTTINWTSGNIFSMTFAAGASAYTMTNASGFQFNQANAATIVNNSSNLQKFTSDVRVFFSGAKTFNAATANLEFGVVQFRADSMAIGQTNTLTLTGASNGIVSGAINTSGTFTNTAAGLRNSVVKTGSGTWELAGVNTYGGLTNVQAGTLTLSGNRTTAMAGGITLGGGGAVAQTLNIQNGNFSLGASYTIGNGGSTAIVNHLAGTIAASGGSQILLGNGEGTTTYNLSGGALSGGIRMGVNLAPTASTNVFNLSGTGALTTSSLQIGRSDAAGSFKTNNTFIQTAGTATVTALSLGGATADAALVSNISGTLNLTGGTFTNTNFTSLSAAGGDTSVITIGGTADVTLGAFPTARGTGSTATINFDGGTLKPGAASASYMGGLTKAFVTANGAKFDVATARDITVSQPLVNAVSQVGTLTKSGVGTLALSGANTYTGVTTISAGSLIVDGSLAGAVSVNAGTLGGSGSVAGLVTTSGVTSIISPGNSPGSLTLNGGLNAAAGATFTAEVGTSTDVIVMGAGVFTGSTAAGGLIWNFSDSGGLTAGNPYILAFFGSSLGLDATDLVAGTLPAGFALDPAFGSSGFQINANNLRVQFAAVPEPGITAALLTGFVLMQGRRRRI